MINKPIDMTNNPPPTSAKEKVLKWVRSKNLASCEIGKTVEGNTFLYDLEKIGLIGQYEWKTNKKGYAYCMDKGKCILMHRHILEFELPEGMIVDHKNHNPLDNRMENLRACTHSQNHMNRRKKSGSKSKYKGVEHKPSQSKKGDWRAYIKINGKMSTIGYFHSEEEAAKAYDERAKFLFGDFAHLNFEAGSDMGLQEFIMACKESGIIPFIHGNCPFGADGFHEGLLVFHIEYQNGSHNIGFDLTKNLHSQSPDFYTSLLPLIDEN